MYVRARPTDSVVKVANAGDGRANLLNQARQDYVMKDVPIVVATADPLLEAPGASAVLAKPIRPERLLGIVRQFVQSSVG
jgi:CheY-like chemotaxis protein